MKVRQLIHAIDPYLGFDASAFEPDHQGWGSGSAIFAALIDEFRPQLILEVGAWKGASTLTMARRIRELQLDTEIVSIDTWLGAWEFWRDHRDPDRYQSLKLRNGYPAVYNQFLANIVLENLEGIVTPFPQTSLIAARFLKSADIRADMIYIDASHDVDDVFIDLMYYSRVIKPDGVIFGDDFDENWPGVRQAVLLFASITGAKFDVFENRYWIIRRPGFLMTRPVVELVRNAFPQATYPQIASVGYYIGQKPDTRAEDLPSTMDTTPNLNLPYIAAAQAQKHVTHNEAIRALDALVQLSVEDKTRTEPPPQPAEGDRHIVAAGASGPWQGQDGAIVAWQDGGWVFLTPQSGWIAWVKDEQRLHHWSGSGWIGLPGTHPDGLQNANVVGINASASTADRLTVASAGTLLNHDGTSHRLRINKENPTATASVIFQTGFEGRAEIGLTGDDNLRLRTSSNAVDWKNVLQADGSGLCQFPHGLNSWGWVSGPQINANGPSGTFRGHALQTDTIFRFDIVLSNQPETGGSTGSDLYINRFADDGTYLGTSLEIVRATGEVRLNGATALTTANLHAPSFSLATLPSAADRGAAAMILVTDAAGGPTLAYSDGTNWLATHTREIIT